MKKICKEGFLYSLGTAAYIVLVALFMNNAEKFLGKEDTIFSGIAFLLLFTLSAIVVGGLMIGKPIMLYIDGKKKDAVKLVGCNAGWLVLFFIIALVIMMIIKK